MKPPKCKRRPPKGYSTYPFGGVNDRICITAAVQEDLSVKVSAPADIKLLYNMGFYGRGSLSRHEPIFDRIILTDKNTIKTYLHNVNTDRYTLEQSTRSLADLEEKSDTSIRTSPQHISTIINTDYPGKPLTLINDGSQASENLTSTSICLNPSNQNDHSQSEHSPHTNTLYDIEITQPEQLQQTHNEQPELSIGLTASPHANERPAGRASLQLTDERIENQKEQLSVSKTEDNEMCEMVEQTTEWKEDTDFWSSEQIPETNIDTDAAVCSPLKEDSGDTEVRYILPRLDLIESDTNLTFTSQSHDVTEESGGDNYDSDTSSDEDQICLDKMTLSDNSDERENKCEYLVLNEHLILDTYEAIFLMLSFSCLNLTDNSLVPVSVRELWNRALLSDSVFYVKYSVYHHIRSKRWVVKDGLSYGCDFMVYKKGPRYYHSSLGIITRAVDSETLLDIPTLNNRHISWTNIMGTSRVINNVRKELMIIYVLIPKSVQASNITEISPINLLKELKICELLVNRTVPSRERELSAHVS